MRSKTIAIIKYKLGDGEKLNCVITFTLEV